MSTLLWTIDPDDAKVALKSLSTIEGAAKLAEFFPSRNIRYRESTFRRAACRNIYETKDTKYFHLHGMQSQYYYPLSTLTFPPRKHEPRPQPRQHRLAARPRRLAFEDTWKPYTERHSQILSEEIQHLASVYK